MATITTKLSLAGTGLTSNQLSLNVNDLLSVTTPHVGLSKLSIAHTGQEELIPASVSAATYIYIRNTDVTNFIVLKNAAGNVWGRLHPGEVILYCVTPGVGMEVTADTAPCIIEYAYWTKA